MIFGGGRRKFMKKTENDYFKRNMTGDRTDGRNLIEEWSKNMKKSGKEYKFVWNLTEFENLKPNQYDHVLGKFINTENNVGVFEK